MKARRADAMPRAVHNTRAADDYLARQPLYIMEYFDFYAKAAGGNWRPRAQEARFGARQEAGFRYYGCRRYFAIACTYIHSRITAGRAPRQAIIWFIMTA